MFVLFRTIIYASLFIGFVLSIFACRLFSWSGILRPSDIEVLQIAGIIIGAACVILVYSGLFFCATHPFVVWYEKPVLKITFGEEYVTYCRKEMVT